MCTFLKFGFVFTQATLYEEYESVSPYHVKCFRKCPLFFHCIDKSAQESIYKEQKALKQAINNRFIIEICFLDKHLNDVPIAIFQ